MKTYIKQGKLIKYLMAIKQVRELFYATFHCIKKRINKMCVINIHRNVIRLDEIFMEHSAK